MKSEGIAGVLLAGGLSRRMGGGDKSLRTLGGRSILERIVAIPRQGRRLCHGVRSETRWQVTCYVSRAGDREIPHHPQRLHPATRHRRTLGGDRTHDDTFPQQPGGVVLVFDTDVEHRIGHLCQHTGEPGRHRVGIDRKCDSRMGCRCTTAGHLRDCLRLQHCRLGGQPKQRCTRSRWYTGLSTDHQHLADLLFQRLDALTHCRGRHMEIIGGCLETSELDNRGERRELTRIQSGLTEGAQLQGSEPGG